MAQQPAIADYALIGDCHSAALVSRWGAIDWCCFHRFDQRAVFSRLIDWERGGTLSVEPMERAELRRAYREDSNVLETRFTTATGSLVVVDAFAVSEHGDETGMPPMQLLRIVRCDRGSVEIKATFKPRFDYGLTVPRIRKSDDRIHLAYGGANALVIESDFPFSSAGEALLEARHTLKAGESRYIALTSFEPHRVHPEVLGLDEVDRRVRRADRFWRDWASRCTYRGEHRDAVVRSALVLKALTDAPTGAIVAAPTTSLPEARGGVRNWDYRYTWLRDAGLHVEALFRIGYDEEAHAFMRWLDRTTAGRARDLKVLYGVGGERLLPEWELPSLAGYRDARPVRIGNSAGDQLQLDIYGHVLETAYAYHAHGGDIPDEHWSFLCEIVSVIGERWREPDNGIWEIRTGRKHFVTSKVMTWSGVDRAIRLAEERGLPADLPSWRRLRDGIRADVLDKGVHPADGYFTSAYGSDGVDAASARFSLVGFVSPDDPRMLRTLARIDAALGEGPLVRRYNIDDGLPGREGAFVIASFWFVMALAKAGQVDLARRRFEQILAYRNDVGLLAEEVDAGTGEQLGNFPQSFSHTGLIAAAVTLQNAQRGHG